MVVICQVKISNLIISDDPDPINIVNNVANILTNTIMNIHNHLPEKNIKSNVSIPLTYQTKQKN